MVKRKKRYTTMTPEEKKELDYISKQATKVAVTIAVLFFTLLILSTIL